MGRKTKLTPEVHEKIVTALRAGNYQETAARYAGISEATFYRWLNESLAEGASKELQQFREAVEKARADAEVRNVHLIQQAANDGTWQAAAWFLERSHHQRWGRKQSVELTGEDGGPVQVENLTPDEANRRLVSYLDSLADQRRNQE
jgi:transposase